MGRHAAIWIPEGQGCARLLELRPSVVAALAAGILSVLLYLAGPALGEAPERAESDVANSSPAAGLQEANRLKAEGRLDKAVQAYAAYLSMHEEDDETRGVYAGLLARLKRWDEAGAVYQAILTRHPDDFDVTVALARLRAWQALYDVSESLYQTVLHRAPEHVDARRGLADTLWWSGRSAEALEQYRILYRLTHDSEVQARMRLIESGLAVSARAPLTRDAHLALPFDDYLKLGYSHYTSTNNFPDERDALIELAKPIGHMTAVGRVEPLNRFGLHDTPVSAELYSPLWSRAWGYIAGSGTVDAQFAPSWTMGGEVFQGLGVVSSKLSRIEVSGGYKRLAFRSTHIDLLTPGITIYLPWNVWLTERIVYVPEQGSMTASTQITWRPTDRLQFQLSGAYGTSGERIVAVLDFQRVKSTIWQGGMIFPITERISGEVYGYYEDRGFLYVRRGGAMNLIWHW